MTFINERKWFDQLSGRVGLSNEKRIKQRVRQISEQGEGGGVH